MDNKLYENIMMRIAKVVKNAINESDEAVAKHGTHRTYYLNMDLNTEEESANPELQYLAIIRQIRDNDKDLFDDAKFKRSSYDKLYGENNHDYWTKKNTCTEFIEAELAKINADLDNTYFVQGIFELSSEQWSKIPNHMVGLNTTFDETGHMTDSSSITASSKNDNARMESDLNAYNLDKLKEIRYVKVNVPACKLSQ